MEPTQGSLRGDQLDRQMIGFVLQPLDLPLSAGCMLERVPIARQCHAAQHGGKRFGGRRLPVTIEYSENCRTERLHCLAARLEIMQEQVAGLMCQGHEPLLFGIVGID